MTDREHYDNLKASGMMWVVWPEATGVWSKDRDDWQEILHTFNGNFKEWRKGQEWPEVIWRMQ